MQLLLAALLAREASEHRATVHTGISAVAWLLAVTADEVERLAEPRALVEWELLLGSVHLVHVPSGTVDYARLRNAT